MVLGKYKAAVSCRQHLVPSPACAENPEDPKLPVLSSLLLCLTQHMKMKKKNLPHLKNCYLEMLSLKLVRNFSAQILLLLENVQFLQF